MALLNEIIAKYDDGVSVRHEVTFHLSEPEEVVDRNGKLAHVISVDVEWDTSTFTAVFYQGYWVSRRTGEKVGPRRTLSVDVTADTEEHWVIAAKRHVERLESGNG